MRPVPRGMRSGKEDPSVKSGKSKRIIKYYPWVIVFTGMLTNLMVGMCSNIMSVYLPFIEERDHLTGAAGSAIVSVRCAFAFLATFFVVRFYERVSLRKGMALAVILAACGYAVMSVGGGAFVYYLGAAFIGTGFSMICTVPVAMLLKSWFQGRYGLATGLCSAGTGLSTLLFSQPLTNMITRTSLRTTFLVHMGIMCAGALLLYLLVRDTPEKLGAEPYRDTAPAGTAPAGATARLPECGHSLSRPAMLVLAVMMILTGGANTSFCSHIYILNTTCGYSVTTAARILSLFSLVLIFGKTAAGAVADRLGGLRTGLLLIAVFCIGCLPALGMDGRNLFFPAAMAVILACGAPVYAMGPPLWVREIVPSRDYARTLQWSQCFFNLGGILLSSIPGMIADRTGEYRSTYILLALDMAVAAVLLVWIYKVQCGPQRQKGEPA